MLYVEKQIPGGNSIEYGVPGVGSGTVGEVRC